MKQPVTRTIYEPVEPPMINRAEVLRYLGFSPYPGFGVNPPDETILNLIDRSASELSAAIRPRCIYAAFPITVKERGVVLRGCDLKLNGLDIAAHLKGCRVAVLMAATLSEQADRLIRQAGVRDALSGMVMDSCATTAVEQFCDDIEAMIKRKQRDSHFTTRYSPGYGDLPIEMQGEFLTLLDAPRKIGLCATDSSILTPSKSVTAILGIANKNEYEKTLFQDKTGCGECRLRDNCAFRKRGDYCGLSKPAQ